MRCYELHLYAYFILDKYNRVIHRTLSSIKMYQNKSLLKKYKYDSNRKRKDLHVINVKELVCICFKWFFGNSIKFLLFYVLLNTFKSEK